MCQIIKYISQTSKTPESQMLIITVVVYLEEKGFIYLQLYNTFDSAQHLLTQCITNCMISSPFHEEGLKQGDP